MTKKFVLGVLLAGGAAALHGQTVAVGASTWTFSGNVQGVTWEEECKFTVDAAHKLTGSCKMQDVVYPVTGSVDGATISFSHGGDYQGTALTLTYKGKIAADGGVAGDVDVSPLDSSGTFSGKQKVVAVAS